MTKPIGYYTSHTPGDGSVLDELQEQYGACLENMSETDKTWLLFSLALHFYSQIPENHSSQTEDLFEKTIAHLPKHDQLGLCQAIISYLRDIPSPEQS